VTFELTFTLVTSLILFFICRSFLAPFECVYWKAYRSSFRGPAFSSHLRDVHANPAVSGLGIGGSGGSLQPAID
jgi:hypothetical protein